MGAASGQRDSWYAGRAVEHERLGKALQGAAAGRPCAIVVQGEAGIGKTSLVRQVCDGLPSGARVLWGTCVHFGAASVPFAPIIGALQSWQAQGDGTAAGVVELMDGLINGGSDSGRLLPMIDRVVATLAADAATVLVCDDLQWADRRSLDVLAYLIAGFQKQRLALLMTCRDEQRSEGHPLHGWLADMRRMPSFSEVTLDRLDAVNTEIQLEGLLGGAVDVEFATGVHEQSGGNPYLTELLVRDRGDTTQVLPKAVPTALRDTLLATWHRLSPATRQTTRILAVGGRPAEFPLLIEVASAHGLDPSLTAGCLVEAQEHGVVSPSGEDLWWFRHPLLAEVLYDALPPGEGARVHASFSRVLSARYEKTPTRIGADLAVHNLKSGALDEAYRWSLIAATEAADLHAPREESLHLERACLLWERVAPDARGTRLQHIDLLMRASTCSDRCGRYEAALWLARQAMNLVDRATEPLLASTLLIASTDETRPRSPTGSAVSPELIDAVGLTDNFPDAPERAMALSELAFAEVFDGQLEAATAHLEEAAGIARRASSDEALASVLCNRAFARLMTSAEAAQEDAEEAERLARQCHALRWLGFASTWHVHSLADQGRLVEAIVVATSAIDELIAGGEAWAYFLSSQAAELLLLRGGWSECRELLRPALAARPGGLVGASVRLTAAQLAIRTGRIDEAGMHLDRALELVSEKYSGLSSDLTATRTEFLLACGEPQQALEWILDRVSAEDAAKPAYGEDHLVDLATAAAAAAGAARDSGDTRAAARVISAVEELLGQLPAAPFSVPRADVAGQTMLKALFDAWVASCRDDENQAALWQAAAESCSKVGAPWFEAVGRFHAAEAMMSDGSSRLDIRDTLRRAHDLAVGLGAHPLRQDVEDLARIARIDLRQPAPPAADPQVDGPAGLTAREQEILRHLVAGRSNGEIARDLFISPKTVSVHVSNLLRKTDTSNRLEVAAWANREFARSDGREVGDST